MVILIVLLVAYGCGSKQIKINPNIASKKYPTSNKVRKLDEEARRVHLENHTPACKVLFNSKLLILKEFEKCLFNIDERFAPYVVDQLIKRKPPVSKEILDKSLITFTHGSVFTKYTDSIKKLIIAGASTENVNLPYVWDGGDFACDTLMLVLKNNLHLYKDKQALMSRPKSNRNVSSIDSKPRNQDLFWFSNTSDGRGICPESIKLLASYNPNLLNSQSALPLSSYLGDVSHPQWDINIAKLLMTRKNVNLHGKEGVTPLHILLMNRKKSKWDSILLKEILERGGDVSIKANVGTINFNTNKRKAVSVKKLIEKRPDLLKVLKNKI